LITFIKLFCEPNPLFGGLSGEKGKQAQARRRISFLFM